MTYISTATIAFGKPAVSRLLILTLLITLAGCGKVELTDAEYVEQAKDHLDKNNFRAGIIELKNALRQNKDNAEARWLLGTIYIELASGASAEKELRRAEELGVSREAISAPLGEALLLQGKSAQALDEIAVSSMYSSLERAKIHAIRGQAHFGERQFDAASKEFKLALEIQPSLTSAQTGQAYLALAQEDRAKAREWAEQALKDAPESAEAWSLLGDIESTQQKYHEAEKAYTKAISHSYVKAKYRIKRALTRITLDAYETAAQDISILEKTTANHPVVYYAKGLMHFQQKQFSQAQAAFTVALNYAPGSILITYYLGASHYALNNTAQSEDFFNKVLSQFPEHEASVKMLSSILFKRQDLNRAAAILRPLFARKPDDLFVLDMMGTIALLQGDFKRGIEYKQKAAALKPDAANSRIGLGMSLLLAGELKQGFKELETAIEMDPQTQRAEILLISSLIKFEEFDKALDAAEKLRRKQPESPVPLGLIGQAYLGKEDEAKAKEAFQQALKIAPGDPQSGSRLAKLAYGKGEIDESRSLFLQVLQHHPGHLETLMQLASLEITQGDAEEGKNLLQQAVQQHPQALPPRLLLARYHLDRGKPFEALAIAKTALESHPDNPSLLAAIGEAQLTAGEASSAVRTFRRLEDVNPESKVARKHAIRLARAQVMSGDSNGGMLTLETWLKQYPTDLAALYNLANIYLHLGHREKAKLAYLKVIDQTPDDVGILNNLAWLLRHEDPEKALQYAEHALELAPEAAPVLDTLGMLMLDHGQTERALKLFTQASEKTPDNLSTRYHFALALSRTGQKEQAREILKAILAKKEPFAEKEEAESLLQSMDASPGG